MVDETKPPTMAEVCAEARKFITACRASTTARVRVSEDGLRVAADSTAGTCIVHVSMLEELADVALDLLRDAPRSEVSVLPGTLTDAEIDAAEARANGATPAKDGAARPGDPVAWLKGDAPPKGSVIVYCAWNVTNQERDGAFIAHARTDVPALARTARAERRRAEEAERERDAAKTSLCAALDREVAIEPTLRALEAANEAARSSARSAREGREKFRIAMRALASAQTIADAWAAYASELETIARFAPGMGDLHPNDRDAMTEARTRADIARAKLEALGVTL